MKARFGRKMKRALTFLMSVVLVAETINCAGMTVSAGTVSAGDVIAINEELKEDVTAAEKAAQAADEAAQAAKEALDAANDLANEAGDAALETAEDGSYTETVTEENGTTKEEPVLKEEIDEAITEAEEEVAEANEETAEVQDDVDEQLAGIVESAESDTAEKLEDAQAAADAAEAAKEKAEKAAEKAQNAGDQFTAEKAAKEAAAAAEEAQKAADDASAAYDEAFNILKDAIEGYNKAVADTELSVSGGDAQIAAQEALDAAQGALDAAKKAVDDAKTEYDKAMADNATAQAAAEEAAKQAGIAQDAAEDTVENLEDVKDADVEDLEAEKAAKEQELQAAIDAQPAINAEQDAIIAEAEAKKAVAEAEIDKYDAAQATVKKMNDKGFLGLGTSELEAAEKVAKKTTSDVKKTEWVRDGWKWKEVKIYYTQAEIDAAKAVVAEYNAAIDVMDSIDVAAQKEIVATAESDIANAEATKNATAQAISDKTAEIAGITASIETVTDYIYDNDEAVTYDMKDNDKYQKLLEELKASTANYNGSVALREKYEDVIDTDEDKLFTKIKKFFEEISMEYNLNGTEISFDWKNGVIYTNDGLTLMIGKDQQNVQTLLKWENDKLTVVTIDEAEFATYSATFDKVAAAQAANRAAEAAVAEKAALDKYNAAVAALEAAQERLDAAKLNKLNIKAAEEALKAAQQNVDDAKAELDRAQEAADAAKAVAEAAKQAVETKPVKVSYFVLNRGLIQPAEVYSYPAANYSKGMEGELYSGVLDEATGKRDDSYIALYKKGIKNSDEIAQYLAVQPTAEQLAERGIVLKEGESIRWYVIKTEGDGYHVDGIITGQKFDITVRYGRYDENGEFVDLAESKTETVGLGETYHIDSREIEDYVAGAAYVEGVATKDETLYVEYTAEETRTVRINYYRGSVAGTLLGTQDLEVAVSKVDAYASTIKTKWLNLKKPGDCNDGEMVSYVVTEDSAVANVVYAPIPVTPVTPPEPTTPEEVPGEGGPVIADANAPVAPVNVIPAPVEEPAEEEPVVEEPVVEEPAEIEEEDAPLAPAIEEQDNSDDAEVVNIEEEETPLAAGNCWIHWLILILTAVYTAYELVRAIARNKKIKELADNGETVRA